MKMLFCSLLGCVLCISSQLAFAESYVESTIEKAVNSMDDNADKKVDFQEYYEESVDHGDDSFDVNRDGYITSGEIEQELKEELIETVDEMNRIGMPEENVEQAVTQSLNSVKKRAEKMLESMDFDHDNLVEKDEFKAYKRKQFATLDKNRDGSLSADDTKHKSSYKGYPIVISK